MVSKTKILTIGAADVKQVKIGKNLPLIFIGGPCAIENRDHAFMMAEKIQIICEKVGISWIYKSCYDKDCRSSPKSFHGLGLEHGLNVLGDIRKEFQIPVVSDFSDASWAKPTGDVCDLVQVPAYLCRQTSILRAAATTSKPVHLKKGQFMSPWNMKNSIRKIESAGNKKILLTERGSFFGYSMLVNDFTSFPIMAKNNLPICYDATHSIQLPTSLGNISGGQREFIPHLVRASCAAGIDVLFMEVHDSPKNALSDKNTVLDLKYLERILTEAKKINETQLELESKYGKEYIKHES